jgi:ATP-binding cassette, subfamily C (CFTR/MRP), member 1
MLELQSGSTTIDGIDLCFIPRETVRSRIITVPQDFVLFDEPIRLALDPNCQHSDDAVIQALRKVHIWSLLQQKEGLDTMGSQLSISHGERQLFALARAILSSGRIVLLDEACSRSVSFMFFFRLHFEASANI